MSAQKANANNENIEGRKKRHYTPQCMATQCTYESNFDKERYHLSVLGCFGSPWFEECLGVVLRFFVFYLEQERRWLMFCFGLESDQLASLRLCADVCFSKLAKMTFKAGNSKKTSQTSL